LAGKSWVQEGNLYGNNIGLPTNFVYPPPSLVFCAVFSILNYEVAKIAWNATNFSIFAIAFIALSLTLKDEKRFLFISIAVLLSLTSYPLLINVQMSQSDLLIASVTILSLVLERLKRPFLSAVLLSSGTLLKGAYPDSKFGVVVYYPFIEEHVNVQNRLRSPDIDGVVFASQSDDSITNAVRMLLSTLKQ
jgi:hypothetical protein